MVFLKNLSIFVHSFLQVVTGVKFPKILGSHSPRVKATK